MKYGKLIVLAATLAVVPCAESAQTLVSERTLSVDAALEIATAALANCRPHGVPVTITVLDHAGRTKVVLRDDGANLHSSEHSLRKAYTALTYGMPSGEYGKRAAANPTSAGPLHLPNITTAAGGLQSGPAIPSLARSASRARPATKAAAQRTRNARRRESRKWRRGWAGDLSKWAVGS